MNDRFPVEILLNGAAAIVVLNERYRVELEAIHQNPHIDESDRLRCVFGRLTMIGWNLIVQENWFGILKERDQDELAYITDLNVDFLGTLLRDGRAYLEEVPDV